MDRKSTLVVTNAHTGTEFEMKAQAYFGPSFSETVQNAVTQTVTGDDQVWVYLEEDLDPTWETTVGENETVGQAVARAAKWITTQGQFGSVTVPGIETNGFSGIDFAVTLDDQGALVKVDGLTYRAVGDDLAVA